MTMNKKRVYEKYIRMPLYIFFIVSMLILSWEAHFFYPQYVGASAQVDHYFDPSSTDFIPEESIRLRIKSNSNSATDQQLKRNIRDQVNVQISGWTASLRNLEQAREVIEARIPELEEVIATELEKLGSDSNFNVSLKEVTFPTKQYGNRVYPAGEYEAVFIEIGDGLGDNWWCVLFPPLCFLEVSDNQDEEATERFHENEASDDEEEEIQVSFFVVEVVQSLWKKFN